MASIAAGGSKPYVVITPFPLQGHINSFLKLAKVIHSKGFHITFVNTDYNHKRLLNSRGPHALDGLPDFCFETIPDGLAPSDEANVSQRFRILCDSMPKNSLVPFTKLLGRLHELALNSVVPRVTCLISDGVMTFTMTAAQEFGLPIAIYWPASTVSFLGIFHFRTLLDKDVIPLKDESYLTNGYLDTELDWVPGMKNVRLKDLPSFVRVTDSNNFLLNFLIAELQKAQTAQAIIFNTFEELDSDALSALSSIFPPLYSIGPLPMLLNQIPHNHHMESIGSNMWKEETKCLDWLESYEPESVIYVNFGSLATLSLEQLGEFAWGLANSKKPFLWIIRPDLVKGGSIILSPEFFTKIKDRGFIANWCEQEKVLNHPSIGGFLTHCGWNSMIESIGAGVPMACWPWSGDQPTNCRYACREWEIGLEIDNNVKKEDVEKLVNELMEGEKGKQMRQNISKWKKIAEDDTKPGGSSYINLENLIKDVLIKTKN
ncbi:7-deoxyloganetin glucosyltransferase-like isoform X1 [Prosopis cineraria]|uniref:7-deoxyloganetin glucosyltransferase-like isoform X1 n=1 Tax=Prosopis cineraria TaxID=364024 RepID=UPI00240EB8C0|nr:7-deoxyloganetin glucosyltransferase-like isoform X1 [Prosopis cineraria]